MEKDEESSAEENFSEDDSEITNKNTLLIIIVFGVIFSCIAFIIARPYYLEYMTQKIQINPNNYSKSKLSIRNASYTSNIK